MQPLDLTLPALSHPQAETRKIIPIILSGGSGTRLWPVSRSTFPKQFWRFSSEHSLIQQAAMRGVGDRFGPPVVVCNHDHRFIIAEQMREIGIEDLRIVLEPVGRNSAPAIAAAALLVARRDPHAVLWVMAADAAITQPEKLAAPLAIAVDTARRGLIVTFGMRPTAPETGYGYIEVGAPIEEVDGAYALSRFVEKPDAALAGDLIASGRHLWNSGMFLFTAETLIEEMQLHAPAVLAAARRAVEASVGDDTFVRLDPAAFSSSPDVSLDYAVAELTSRAAVVPADFGWSDVGSWSSLWQMGDKDAEGNVASPGDGGHVTLEGAKNCYVRADGMVAAVAGLSDVMLIATKDAVLAVHRDRAQDVKKIVAQLTAAGRAEATSHNRIYRPWGFYESLINGDRFQVKRICVKPGEKLSLQKHFHRAEHWVVVNGTAIVTRDDEEVMLRENESIYLPLGCVHRLFNPGKIPLALIEVQSGGYLGEDDIVRIEDTYGRN